ncbi:uncharacterized protein UV8b_01085 [Ustilaginoidea virens]|uniref:Folliculin-interacting protein N-terminal domain-containing protein n=1 Tax=Ustilaginoidea virens TaxID=1159556 RepID=A0A063C651_USTVR|nr:uncharacterized protein UV8b_01085 [Ustilaginoidea virens]QUC16844.1 hypothetical protein UV8b_01085 [Ustilaginoidea virens]GAO16821.1 hypothetical protein UVI_02053600 [Ustilaginoidea virens]
MLGRLLHLGSGGSGAPLAEPNANPTCRPILSLESVQEDIHTRNLLFPDAEALYQHRHDQVFPLSTNPPTPGTATANVFDYSEDIELDVKDVRIIVMQDALGPANSSLLFDSHPLPEPAPNAERSPARQDPRRAAIASRKGSLTQVARPLVIQAESPQLRHGAFDRRASMHGRSQSYAETEAQKAAREYREELATFSSCIFGNSELMAYKGTSTKVHVVPSDSRISDSAASSMFSDGRSSIGRSSVRSSKLSQSYTSQAASPAPGGGHPLMGNTSRQVDRRKVLITRLFPVTLSVDDTNPNTTSHNRLSEEEANGFPFPASNEEAVHKKKKPLPKQRRTPMYAVVLIIQIPPPMSKVSSTHPSKSLFRESSSYNDNDLFSSSYNSTKAAWGMSGSGMCGDSVDSVEAEDRIDALTRHWDIIMRTLTHLQSLVATRLHSMLKHADSASPGPYPASSTSNTISRTPSMTDRRGNELSRAKPPKGTTKLVSLLPNCLANDEDVASEVGSARGRIVMGLSAARVVTGQGRWGIWRDEAIWTSKWAASMDRTSFFHNLLTGFLSTHTDWLQALCESSYRKRAALARRARNEEDLSLPARTIIVSDNKMAARRLVFLLSAFLPANQQVTTARAHRASTSASAGGYSNSPPTFIIPVLREESLRRKINRRSGLRRTSHSRTTSQSARNSTTIPPQFATVGFDGNHQRRASDAASIRTANLPMPGTDIVMRKSSAATMTTIMLETTTTPHFTSFQHQRDNNQRRPRPGSSGSVAADDLKRSLRRSDSSGQPGGVSRPPSSGLKWGSLIGGLWNPRRRDSVDSETYSQGSSDLRSPVKTSFGRTEKLSETTVRESPEERASGNVIAATAVAEGRDVEAPRDSCSVVRGQGSFAQADRTPDPTGAFESPVKTSINAEDGVIDVDVPFPDYITSFESAISSPSSSGYLSTPGLSNGLETFEQTRFAIEGDLPLNTAGWLNRFHPDFALQALPPQENLVDMVKAALRAEPTPTPAGPQATELSERWVDVSSVMIADTTTNSISRIAYRRLVRPKSHLDRPSTHVGSVGPGGTASLAPSVLPYETQLEEEWIEEPIFNCDESLREAVDRVTHLHSGLSKGSSTNSSKAPSARHGSIESDSTMPDTLSETTQLAKPALDTPRAQCKTVILSALEDLFREAVDNRDSDHMGRGSDRQGRNRQSILRDAVRNWVASLDAVE